MLTSTVTSAARKLWEIAARSPLARSRRFARHLKPRAREDLIYLGSSYGGWAIPGGLISRESICYCAGVGFDISFDLALIERFGCDVHAFDPTPSAAAHVRTAASREERFRFHPVGLWSSDRSMPFYEPRAGDQNYSAVDLERTRRSIVVQFRAIASLMREFGHSRIDLLKLDIEGSEYEVIDSLVADRIPVRVLCVEFHKNPGIREMKRSVDVLRSYGLEPCHQKAYDVTFVASDGGAGGSAGD